MTCNYYKNFVSFVIGLVLAIRLYLIANFCLVSLVVFAFKDLSVSLSFYLPNFITPST